MRFQFTVAIMLFVAAITLAEEPKQDPSKVTKATDPPTNTPHDMPKPTTTTAPTTPSTAPTTPSTTPTTAPTTPSTTPTTAPTTPTTAPTTPSTTPTTPTIPSTKPTPPPTTPAPTTVAPSTTPGPSPTPVTDWVVKDKSGNVCIIASMDIKITVPYKSTNNKTVDAEFSLDNVANATATGECGVNVQTLSLNWSNITSTFKFQENKDNTSYHLSSIEVDIIVNNNTFPNNTMFNASKVSLKYDAQVFSVPVNHSYTCSSLSPLNLNGTSYNGTKPLNGTFPGTFAVSKVHVEAFGHGKDAKYSSPKDCSPFETPDIVPIVVGLVLAGLVVVVLIAYLVGRRRAQARGYLSM